MARPDNPATITIRRVTTGGGEPAEGGVGGGTTGNIPQGPSGTPIVTVGGGISGGGTALPPAGGTQTGIPPAANPVTEQKPQPQPEVQGPPAYVPDWWNDMPVSDKADLIRQLETLQTYSGSLETKVTQLSNKLITMGLALAVAEKTLADIPTGGIKGDKGDPGTDGKDGVDGKDGKDGKDGRDGRDGVDGRDGSLFTNTPEYVDLVQNTSSASQRAIEAKTRADSAMTIALTARSGVSQLQSTISTISSGAPVVPIGPSAAQIADAVANYMAGHPISGGANGKDGADATDTQVQNAVDDWLKRNPVAGVTTADITKAVSDYLKAHPPSVSGGGGTTTVVTTNPYVLEYNGVIGVLENNMTAFYEWLISGPLGKNDSKFIVWLMDHSLTADIGAME